MALGSYLKNIDKTIRPQDDFFRFACGNWIKNHPIPPTKSRWGTFDVLGEETDKKLHVIVGESRDPLIRNLYRSGMDIKRRNSLGIKPIEKWLEKIQAIKTKDDLICSVIDLHRDGFPILWHTGVGPDDKNSERYITFISQGGLSLPDRDFYLKTDVRSKQIREAFKKHVERMFILAGMAAGRAKKNAVTILSFETKLARISMNKVDMRDIEKIYNKKSVRELSRLAPNVPWKRHFSDIGLPHFSDLVVMQPDFLSRATKFLDSMPLLVWQTYLMWNILDDASSFLSNNFEKEQFEFYGKILTGKQKMEPRWKYVLGVLEGSLGEVLGKEYVKRYFPYAAKKKIDELVSHLFAAYTERIKNLDWMSKHTKKKALRKLRAISRKLGYPDKWKSYRGLVITPHEYFENARRAGLYERKRQFKRLHKKVDRNEWYMTPQTVNAYYSPNTNEIAFPAGILQPPFFDPKADDAFNFGAIGSVIGHEITHGFDDQGAKFDRKGNWNDWWTKEDKKRFEKKGKKLVAEFNKYKVGDLTVNGKLTLGENIADLGGMSIAYDAYMRHLTHDTCKILNDFTPEQRFFLGCAIVECVHKRPEYERTMVLVDPHSPGEFRVNGPVSNLPEFYKAFGIKKGDKLYRKPQDRAKIW